MYIDKKAGHEEHDVSCQFLIGNVYQKDGMIILKEDISVKYQFLIGNVYQIRDWRIKKVTMYMCQFLIGNVYLKLYCVEEEITSEEVSIPYR